MRLLERHGGEGDHTSATDVHERRADGLPLPGQPGIYNVIWVILSRIDGHDLRGSYPFTVLNADGSVPAGREPGDRLQQRRRPTPRTDGVAVRRLSLLGLVIVVGGALLVSAVGRGRRGRAAAVG